MTTADKIHKYLNDSFVEEDDETIGIGIGIDDDLLECLDSLQVLRMVTDLESMLGFKVENSDMTPENLGTIAKLATYIDGRI